MGAHLYIGDDYTGVPLPWSLAAHLPLLGFASPVRFMVYVWLAIAVALACWLTRASPRLRWAAIVVVCVTLVPSLTGLPWGTRVDSPALMSATATLARYVPTGATVLALPFGIAGDSMSWQTESNFRFRLAGGYVSVLLPAAYKARLSFVRTLMGGREGPKPRAMLCSFLHMTGATMILLRDGARRSLRRLLATLGIAPAKVGGFSIAELGTREQISARCARLSR